MPRKSSSRMASIFLLALLTMSCVTWRESSPTPGASAPSPTATGAVSSPTRATPSAGGDLSPVSEGRCGAGVCEGPENAHNCPEECATEVVESPQVAPPARTGGPDYEPPINVFLVLYIDPAVDKESNTFEVESGFYQRTCDENSAVG